MKTTIELPDELYRRVKVKCAFEGKTVREVATSLFQQWADGTVPRGPGQAASASALLEAGRRRERWLTGWTSLADELGRLSPEGGVVDQLLRDRR